MIENVCTTLAADRSIATRAELTVTQPESSAQATAVIDKPSVLAFAAAEKFAAIGIKDILIVDGCKATVF